MASFATVSDLATHMETNLSAADTATAEQALELATGSIKSYTGHDIEVVDNRTQTFRASTATDKLVLRHRPVRVVDSVLVDTVAFTDYDIELEAAIITRFDYGAWSSMEKIVVQYDSGFTTIPPSVKLVCMNMATRLMGDPAGWASESLGSYSRTAASEAEGGLTKPERTLLNRYRA